VANVFFSSANSALSAVNSFSVATFAPLRFIFG
jgi:hypothetical protein